MPGPDVVLPVSPAQIAQRKEHLPSYVTLAFNEMLNDHLRGHQARFTQSAVVESMLKFAGRLGVALTREDVFSRGLLNVEDHYAEHGWQARYVKQSIGDTEESHFVFVVDPNLAAA